MKSKWIRKQKIENMTEKTPEYQAWQNMKVRCYWKPGKHYKNYGGRGITVCSKWRKSFQAFYQDMGLRPEGYTLERIDNNDGYHPGNCKWATRKENNNNQRSNLMITFSRRTQTASMWCDELKIIRGTLYTRIRNGMDPAEALKKGMEDKIKSRLTGSPTANRAKFVIEYDGRTQTAVAWCKELGINISTFYNRTGQGMDPAEALRVCLKKKNKQEAA
jgi:hypothetical protein